MERRSTPLPGAPDDPLARELVHRVLDHEAQLVEPKVTTLRIQGTVVAGSVEAATGRVVFYMDSGAQIEVVTQVLVVHDQEGVATRPPTPAHANRKWLTTAGKIVRRGVILFLPVILDMVRDLLN